MMNYINEIQRRRTFVIIFHPDAGEATLTEKLLLHSGVILSAGSVKGRKVSKYAISGWMKIEKQRGISVTSSALQFECDGFRINIPGTPGHQDFSENTYRTLMATGSVVMMTDASKGVEAQAKKLFKICLLRKIPILTFINKMGHAAMNSSELPEHIEGELGIATYATNWPVGSGEESKGAYERDHHRIIAFHGGDRGQRTTEVSEGTLGDKTFRDVLDGHFFKQLREDSELLDIASTEFDQEFISKGELTPVFFDGTLTNFGVELFLSHSLDMATSPLSRESSQGEINPTDERFSAFVFKIQADMNKAHHDCIVSMRICSG